MSSASTSCLATHELGIRVPGRKLVADLDIEFRKGELVAVLGRNGAGKTLTMLTLAGLRAADAGYVSLGDAPIASIHRTEVAKRLALLTQDVEDIFPGTVLETALIGRHPHIARWQWETATDRELAAIALARMDIVELAERDILTLSGGERRRLAVAQILAQAPDVYLLDEPTNHLDPQHQLDVLNVFRDLADGGATVIASLHDVNLASRYADRCLLLFGDGRWELGDADDILDERSLAALYGTPIESVNWRDRRLFVAAGKS